MVLAVRFSGNTAPGHDPYQSQVRVTSAVYGIPCLKTHPSLDARRLVQPPLPLHPKHAEVRRCRHAERDFLVGDRQLDRTNVRQLREDRREHRAGDSRHLLTHGSKERVEVIFGEIVQVVSSGRWIIPAELGSHSDVTNSMATPRYHHSLTNSIAHWASFDKQVIDPMDVEQLRKIATALQVNPTQVFEAIKRVGEQAGDVRRYLQQARP